MKTLELKGEKRSDLGKKSTKALRNEGLVPCVLYDGKENLHFSLSQKQFSKIIFTPETFIIELSLGGEKKKAILQDIQYHPVTDLVLHADFYPVLDDQKIKVSLPVNLEGYAEGLRQGGRLSILQRKLLVRGYAKDLPEYININIEHLKLEESVQVKEVSLDNVEFLNAPSSVIAVVSMTRAAKSAKNMDPGTLETDEGEEGAGETAEGGDA